MGECNHTIGLLDKGDYAQLVNIDQLKEHIHETLSFNKMLQQSNFYQEISYLKHKEFSIFDYADFRKSTGLQRFLFCPDCGNKIDWKQIRKGDSCDKM